MTLDSRHPGTQHLVQFFTYDHLPPHLQATSKPFADLVDELLAQLPDGPELTACLRRLLEAKDCAVRQALISDR